jgi:hypothetical protein
VIEVLVKSEVSEMRWEGGEWVIVGTLEGDVGERRREYAGERLFIFAAEMEVDQVGRECFQGLVEVVRQAEVHNRRGGGVEDGDV